MATPQGGERWLAGVAKVFDGLWVLRARADLDPDPRRGWRLQIRVRFESDRPDGMPAAVMMERLSRLEDDLVAHSSGRAQLVVIATLADARGFFLYLSDESQAEELAGWVATSNPDLRIDHLVELDPEWQAYALLRAKARAAHGDRIVIDQLRAAGADLDAPRRIRYLLYLPDETAALAARAALVEHEFEVEISPAATTSEWSVVASYVERATPAVIAQRRESFEWLASTHGGTFDGWEAALQPA
jgi:hypothetical protein